MYLPRVIKKHIPGFDVKDIKDFFSKGFIEIHLEKQSDNKLCLCSRCGAELTVSHGKYRLRLKTLPIFNFTTYLCLWREKRFCPNCKKVRSEELEFIANETPHLTKEYAWWMGKMCEFSPVSRVAEFTGNHAMSVYRLDFERMRRMFQQYKIPPFKRITVDEVYARKKIYYAKESRDKRFFKIIRPEKCSNIEVVAADQHDPYKASVNEHCPNATFVWDRFHIMQTFENAVNEDRQHLHGYCDGEIKRLTRSKFAKLFLKKAERRTQEEKRHIEDVLGENTAFCYLEFIKEGMFQIFEAENEGEARYRFDQLGLWIHEQRFRSLTKWWANFNKGWDIFKNYFKLKILQVCGFLNSKYISMNF